MDKTLFNDYEPAFFHSLDSDYFTGFTLRKYEKKLLLAELKRRGHKLGLKSQREFLAWCAGFTLRKYEKKLLLAELKRRVEVLT